MKYTIEKLRNLVGKEIVWDEGETKDTFGKILGVSISGKYVSVLMYGKFDHHDRKFVVESNSIISEWFKILDIFD